MIRNFLLFCICLIGTNCSSTKKAERISKIDKSKEMFIANRPLFTYIAGTMQLSKVDTIYDVASGMGFSSALLAEQAPKETVFYQEDIDRLACNKFMFNANFNTLKSTATTKNFKFFKGTETTIPYPTNTCKHVTVFISLHEFRQLVPMLQEIKRILHPTGSVYVLEKFYKQIPEKDPNCGYVYLKENVFYDLLKEQNFKIKLDTITSDLSESKNLLSRYLILGK